MVRYALLGLLREQRDYGYRLKRRFDDRVGALWHLNIGQVYQTLRSLEKAGLVLEVDAMDAIDFQPARRLFELTAKGQRVLERWLQRPPSRPRPVRDETLIRLLLLEPGNSELALARVAAQESMYRKHLARLLGEKRRLAGGPGDGWLVGHLGLEAALLHTEAHLKWLEYCRQRLQQTDVADKAPEAGEAAKQTAPAVGAREVATARDADTKAQPRSLRMA